MVVEMVEWEKKASKEIAQIFKKTTEDLNRNPMGVYVLKDAEDRLREIVNKKYTNIPDAMFLVFFYENFRYHLWFHIAADASLRVSDAQTVQIIDQVAKGLNMLARALELYDKKEIYDALKYMIYNYLVELNREEEI